MNPHNVYTAKETTAQSILKFVKDETKIDFKFDDSQCQGKTFVAQGLAQVMKVIATFV